MFLRKYNIDLTPSKIWLECIFMYLKLNIIFQTGKEAV